MAGIGILSAILLLLSIFTYNFLIYSHHICPNNIGSFQCAGLSYTEALEQIQAQYHNLQIDDFALEDSIHVDDTRLLAYLSGLTFQEFKEWKDNGLSDTFLKEKKLLSLSIRKNRFLRLVNLYNQKHPTKSEYKVISAGEWYDVIELPGDSIDSDSLLSAVKTCLQSHLLPRRDDLTLEDYPLYSKRAKRLMSAVEEANRYLKWQVSYRRDSIFPEDYTIIKLPLEAVTISKNGEVAVDSTCIEKQVKQYLKENVSENRFPFKTHDGKTVYITKGAISPGIDEDAEIEEVYDLFANLQSESGRVPETTHIAERMKEQYIEISLSDQHVWYYENGKCVMDSPCVTGNLHLHHATPDGLYAITEMQRNRILKGRGYRSFVNYWMRITPDGIGLHDATWRSRFGGEIYKTNGSHSCINLPLKFAKKIYRKVHYGCIVVLY